MMLGIIPFFPTLSIRRHAVFFPFTCSSAVCLLTVQHNIVSNNRKSKGDSAAEYIVHTERHDDTLACVVHYPMLHVNDKIIWWNKYDLHNACHIRYFSMSLIILLWATTNSLRLSRVICGEQTGWMDGCRLGTLMFRIEFCHLHKSNVNQKDCFPWYSISML